MRLQLRVGGQLLLLLLLLVLYLLYLRLRLYSHAAAAHADSVAYLNMLPRTVADVVGAAVAVAVVAAVAESGAPVSLGLLRCEVVRQLLRMLLVGLDGGRCVLVVILLLLLLRLLVLSLCLLMPLRLGSPLWVGRGSLRQLLLLLLLLQVLLLLLPLWQGRLPHCCHSWRPHCWNIRVGTPDDSSGIATGVAIGEDVGGVGVRGWRCN